MKTIKLVALFALSIIIFNSCSKENTNSPATTTVADDKQNITKTINDFYGCLNNLDDGDLSNFMLYSLFNTTNQKYNDSYINSLKNKFELQFGKIILNDKLQFANRTGIYTWNNATKLWTKTNNSSVITLNFPSRLNQSIVDSELTFSSYSDMATTFKSVTTWLPTAANLTLKRSGNLIFSMNLNNVTFDVNPNFSMPTNADITILTSPFNHTFQWKRISNTEFKLSYSSSTPQGCGTSSTTTFKLYDADYGNITSVKNDLKTIDGTLTEGNLKIVYSVNVQAIAAFSDPTVAQINNNSDAEVFYNNLKIGDLTYDKINNKSEIFIIYSDGSRENVSVYVNDFENQIKTIFANYLN